MTMGWGCAGGCLLEGTHQRRTVQMWNRTHPPDFAAGGLSPDKKECTKECKERSCSQEPWNQGRSSCVLDIFLAYTAAKQRGPMDLSWLFHWWQQSKSCTPILRHHSFDISIKRVERFWSESWPSIWSSGAKPCSFFHPAPSLSAIQWIAWNLRCAQGCTGKCSTGSR